MKGFNEKMCPRCQQARMKHWTELSGEEKFLAERLPLSAEFSRAERQKHLFCPRCWLETIDDALKIV